MGPPTPPCVGSWRKRFRVTEGEDDITRHEDKTTRTARCFCPRCGTPLFYERAHSPRYHVGIDELRDWTYAGEPLVPLKGFPGIVWERPSRRKRSRTARIF